MQYLCILSQFAFCTHQPSINKAVSNGWGEGCESFKFRWTFLVYLTFDSLASRCVAMSYSSLCCSCTTDSQASRGTRHQHLWRNSIRNNNDSLTYSWWQDGDEDWRISNNSNNNSSTACMSSGAPSCVVLEDVVRVTSLLLAISTLLVVSLPVYLTTTLSGQVILQRTQEQW